MRKHAAHNESGFGHIGIVLAIVVVALVAFSGWLVFNKNKDEGSSADTALQEAIKNAKCDYDDKDLCKFFTSWKAVDSYTVTSKQTGGEGPDSNMTIKTQGLNKAHIIVDGATPYEIVTIGNTTYTKDSGDGKWWKQTLNPDTPTADAADSITSEFTVDEPTKEEAATYKKLGKEKCGSLTCFKYEIVDPASTDTKQYIWFDDQDYQLRRMQNIDAQGSYDATISYGNVHVHAPSPTKELGSNQYIVPGQSEPVTMPADMPSEADLERYLEQLQN